MISVLYVDDEPALIIVESVFIKSKKLHVDTFLSDDVAVKS